MRRVRRRLYGGDQEFRLRQEILLGIGGVRLLRALGVTRAVWHANEGHSAFMMIERVRELVEARRRFEQALDEVRASTVFTTHTPVPAGHDAFPLPLIEGGARAQEERRPAMTNGRSAAESRTPSRSHKDGPIRRFVRCTSAGAVGAVVPAVVAAQERVYEWHWGMHPMWGVVGAGMMLMMLVFWAVVIVGIVFGIRWLVSQGRPTGTDTALEILRQRYARGEIDKQEFEARKRDLR